MRLRCVALLAGLAVWAVAAGGETLQGTVTNDTHGQPAAGVEVTLMSLSQGMTEAGRARTDASGQFKVDYGDAGAPHLLRVTYQQVDYFKMVPPGSGPVSIPIYDSARKVDGIATTVDVVRLQTERGTLQVMQVFAVQNHSQPARTLLGDRSYEIALPAGAVVEEAAARSPGGQPIAAQTEPVPGNQDHYVFSFPLRPGETQFQVAYHLPYSGQQAILTLPVLHDSQHVVAILPTSMQFSGSGAQFSPMAEDKTANVQVASNVPAGARVAMSISGIGVLPDENPQQGSEGNSAGQPGESAGAQGDAAGTQANAMPSQGPGGGLGAPIDAPDPLSRYRLPLLGVFAALLIAGGVLVARRRPAEVAAAAGGALVVVQEQPVSQVNATASRRSSPLLEGIKEELFQLELDRQQGRISEADYADAKAALDKTLKRAASRVNKE